MPASQKMLTPPPIETQAFSDAGAAVDRLEQIYERNTAFLRDRFEAYAKGEPLGSARARLLIHSCASRPATYARLDSRLSYGFVAGPGVYETTVTRPDLFRAYLTEQIGLLIENHGVPVEIGESDEPIPIHFAYRRDINVEAGAACAASVGARARRCAISSMCPISPPWTTRSPTARSQLPPGAPAPLALFRAARVDYSLHRLYHYTGTDPEHFQNFVIFTNYQFYIDAFAQHLPRAHGGRRPGATTPSSSQATSSRAMPASASAARPARRRRARRRCRPFISSSRTARGITMINIGTGPSNARNITDHVAVLRPHAWLMLGHCAGLRQHAAARRLRAGAWLSARGPRARSRSCRFGCRSRRSPRCRSRSSRRSAR